MSLTRKQFYIGAIIALVTVYIAGIWTGCTHSAVTVSSSKPSRPIPIQNGFQGPPAPRGISVQYLPGKVYIDHDTLREVDTLVRSDTVVEEVAAPPKPFSLPGAFSIAQPIIAAFKPAQPRGLIEIWGTAGHEFLGSGYYGSIEGDINLDQLAIANATIFAEVGWHHSAFIGAGVRGKFWSSAQ